jgi:hypothetical protein
MFIFVLNKYYYYYYYYYNIVIKRVFLLGLLLIDVDFV